MSADEDQDDDMMMRGTIAPTDFHNIVKQQKKKGDSFDMNLDMDLLQILHL